MRYRYHTADVFTTERFGGNQLAVIPEATGLTPVQMQQIARVFNYSETVFILPPRDPSCLARLRIFTPDEELPFAGHPTIGAAFVLHRLAGQAGGAGSDSILLDEDAGPVRVDIETGPADTFRATLTTPRLPEYRSLEIPATYLARLIKPMGINVSRLASGLPVGGDLEYADEVTLGRAFEGRTHL